MSNRILRPATLSSAPPPTAVSAPAVSLEEVTRRYGAVTALDRVTWELRPGTFTAVMGRSGSGKSTLLQLASGLDAPTSGTVRVGGIDLGALGESARTRLRRERIGFVFQGYNLMPSLDVRANVTLPLFLGGREVDERWLGEVVHRVGMADLLAHRPSQLSGGQQQRVAVARALVTRPEVVFADEPTAALDPTSARHVLKLLREAVDHLGATVVLVTHDPTAAAWADDVLFLSEGRIVDHVAQPSVAALLDRWDSL